MALDNDILRCIGGTSSNSLCELLNEKDDDDTVNGHIETVKYSPYFADNFFNFLQENSGRFCIFNSNLDSLFSKYNEILLLIESLAEHDLAFQAFCFQECYINSNTDITPIQIPGYNCITLPGVGGRKCGLAIYLQNGYNFNVLPESISKSNWEWLLIEKSGNNLKKKYYPG